VSAGIVYFRDGDDVTPFIAADGQPVPRICEVLRRVLAEAERGEIRAIGLAIVSGSPASSFTVNAEFVIGLGAGWALESAARRLSKQIEG
jgi:hypothetical protein